MTVRLHTIETFQTTYQNVVDDSLKIPLDAAILYANVPSAREDEPNTPESEAKVIMFCALNMLFTRRLAKGERVPDVAKAFFSASEIKRVEPRLLQDDYDDGIVANILTNDAGMNATAKTNDDVYLLQRIAYHSLSSASFQARALAAKEFRILSGENGLNPKVKEAVYYTFKNTSIDGGDQNLDVLKVFTDQAHSLTERGIRRVCPDYEDLEVGIDYQIPS